MKQIRLTQGEFAALLHSVHVNEDGSYSLELPDSSPDFTTSQPITPDESPTRDPEEVEVHIGTFIYNVETGMAIYQQGEFKKVCQRFEEARNKTSTGLPIAVLASGQILVAYITTENGVKKTRRAEIHLSDRRTEILRLIIKGHGSCSRLEAMDKAISRLNQMKMKDPEGAMDSHIKEINKVLSPYKLSIKRTPTDWYLAQN